MLLPAGLPFCEDLQGDLVTVESPGRTGVSLDVDEQLDDLILRNAVVESDTQLPTQRYERPESCRDRHGYQGATFRVETLTRPRVTERVSRCQPAELLAQRGLTLRKRDGQRCSQQLSLRLVCQVISF